MKSENLSFYFANYHIVEESFVTSLNDEENSCVFFKKYETWEKI